VQEKYAYKLRKQLIFKKKPAKTMGEGIDHTKIYH